MATFKENQILTYQATLIDDDNDAVDISSASSVVAEYTDPDGTTGTWSASISGGGTGGVVSTDIPANVLTEGDWLLVFRVQYANGNVWSATGHLFIGDKFQRG